MTAGPVATLRAAASPSGGRHDRASPLLDERDGPRDECGVFGIYAPEHDVSRLAYFALYALQHRGPGVRGHRRGRPRRLHHHPARAGPGQPGLQGARPPRAGAASSRSATSATRPPAPTSGRTPSRCTAARARSGNRGARAGPQRQPDQRRRAARASCASRASQFSSTSDSEIIAALLATHPAERLEDAVADVLPRLQGAFSTVVMTQGPRRRLPRPAPACARWSLGQLGDRYCVASESCAFDIIGAKLPARRRSPARWSRSARTGSATRQVVEGEREAFCVFEYIYFARPDSRMGGDVLQAARGRMGEILAREAPAPDADLVIACPTPATPPPAASRAPRACPRTTA